MTATHEVFNQVEPLSDRDLLGSDRALQDTLRWLAPAQRTLTSS